MDCWRHGILAATTHGTRMGLSCQHRANPETIGDKPVSGVRHVGFDVEKVKKAELCVIPYK
uniref:Uncharacterized protein n=1 Tax=Romanomermis culicivorax TaxID=13658 RepID=A0A915K3A5_ROMCU